MYKPLADSTLQRMKKTEIIELLRIAEHNAKVAQEYVDQQAKNMKDWKPAVHGSWGHLGGDEWWCSVCGFVITTEGSWDKPTQKYCENCGAKMDGGDTDETD